MVDLPDFRYYTQWHHHANKQQYAAPADPWNLIAVDPTNPERFNVVSLLWGLGRVRGGNWDCPDNCRTLTDTPMYEGLTQHFEADQSWTATVYHDWVAETIDEAGHFRGYETLDIVREEHYPAVDDLYASIRDDGYRPNHGSVYADPADIDTVHELDPLILIGRSGEVLWTEGFHRLFLARLLDVDTIQVYVLRRHAAWQRIRDRIADAPTEELPPDLAEYRPHPDVRDVLQ